MKVYVIGNLKGGVGKTTTTVNLAYTYAEMGGRTLVIDLDPQCNCTRFFAKVNEYKKQLKTFLKPLNILIVQSIVLSMKILILLKAPLRHWNRNHHGV